MTDKRMQGAEFILQTGAMIFRSRLRRDFEWGKKGHRCFKNFTGGVLESKECQNKRF